MRIIGIDPGTICCGYGIVEVRSEKLEMIRRGEPAYVTSGDIKMNKRAPLPERLKVLYDSLKKIFDEYKPSQVCIEKVFFHKNVRSALTLGSTRGITMLLAAEKALPLVEYNSTELKLALTGYGRAEKGQVQEMVIRILKIKPSLLPISKDSSDALALCICHINSLPLKSQITSTK